MSLEADIYTAVWDHFHDYHLTQLEYVRGWYKSAIEHIAISQLPAVSIYPTGVIVEAREGRADYFTLQLIIRGSIQHFDISEPAEGTTGRKGILDFYHDLDRVAFTMMPRDEVTVNSVTTTTQVFPIFTDVEAVRDVVIDDAIFSSETYNDDYPNMEIIIPIDIFYLKKDSVRYID